MRWKITTKIFFFHVIFLRLFVGSKILLHNIKPKKKKKLMAKRWVQHCNDNKNTSIVSLPPPSPNPETPKSKTNLQQDRRRH